MGKPEANFLGGKLMYDELVRRLRICPDYNDGCVNCQHEHDLGCRTTTMREAADAIEELNKRNCELLFQVCQAEALIDYYQTGRMVSNEPPKEEFGCHYLKNQKVNKNV